MKNFLTSLISENNGGISSSRLLLLFLGIGGLAIWIYTTIIKKEMASIPTDIVTILLGLSATKTIQRFGEN